MESVHQNGTLRLPGAWRCCSQPRVRPQLTAIACPHDRQYASWIPSSSSLTPLLSCSSLTHRSPVMSYVMRFTQLSVVASTGTS